MIDLNAGQGHVVCEYATDTGPAGYVLFVDRKPVGVIEAKKEDIGQNIASVEEQTGDDAAAELKWVQNPGEPSWGHHWDRQNFSIFATELSQKKSSFPRLQPSRANAAQADPLRDEIVHEIRLLHSCQFHVQPLERRGKTVVSDSELMQHGRVEIPGVNDIVDLLSDRCDGDQDQDYEQDQGGGMWNVPLRGK